MITIGFKKSKIVMVILKLWVSSIRLMKKMARRNPWLVVIRHFVILPTPGPSPTRVEILVGWGELMLTKPNWENNDHV